MKRQAALKTQCILYNMVRNKEFFWKMKGNHWMWKKKKKMEEDETWPGFRPRKDMWFLTYLQDMWLRRTDCSWIRTEVIKTLSEHHTHSLPLNNRIIFAVMLYIMQPQFKRLESAAWAKVCTLYASDMAWHKNTFQ